VKRIIVTEVCQNKLLSRFLSFELSAGHVSRETP
jgi:hypothetical protein